MTKRTLPTHDVRLPNGRFLHYKGPYQPPGAPLTASVFKGNGGLTVLVSIDEDQGQEVLRFSASYPDRTPNDADIQAICYAILGPGGGTVRALLPEHNPDSRHGHVVHLLEVPRPAPPVVQPDGTTRGGGGQPPAAAEPSVEDLIQAVFDELGLARPFTAEQFRAAFDRVQTARGTGPQERRLCAQQRLDGSYLIAVPPGLSIVEAAHFKYHQLGHITLKHVERGKAIYSEEQEADAEAFTDAMMAYSLCGEAAGDGVEDKP